MWDGRPRVTLYQGSTVARVASEQHIREIMGATFMISKPRLKNNPNWRVILHLRIPGTMSAGYPEYLEPLRGWVQTVVESSARAH